MKMSKQTKVLSLSLGVILLGSIAFFSVYRWFLPFTQWVDEMIVVTQLSEELNNVLFLSDSPTETTLHRVGKYRLTSEPAGSTIVSMAQTGEAQAWINKDADGTYRVYQGTRELIVSKTAKAGIAQSPDGKRVAYAEANDEATVGISGPQELPFASLETREWHITLMNTEANTFIRVGTGIAPMFIDNTHVAWFSPRGVYVADIETGVQTLLAEQENRTGLLAVLQSPDHSLMAWRDVVGRNLIVFKVSDDKAEKISTIPMGGGIASLALGNDGMYSVRLQPGETGIYKQGFDGGNPVLISRLPTSLKITRILLGSL